MFAASFLVAFGLTVVGTRLVRRYALARSILDVPNSRSSHAVPTPRGGGFAITVVLLAGVAIGALAGAIPFRTGLGIVVGGTMVALVGWIDDHTGVRASYRAVVHFAAATLGVVMVGGLPDVRIGSFDVHLGIFGTIFAIFVVVWFVNLYNFMDGIDGIAGGNALVAGLFGAALVMRSDPGLALVAIMLAGCSAGFLVWNWPPAKIFLGDVGSGLLGYVFAMLAIATEQRKSAPLLLWFLLLNVFIVDATLTLARRVMRGERWYAAHRSHAYQRLVQAGWSHLAVSAAVILLDLLLGTAALFVADSPGRQLAVYASFIALVIACYLIVERIQPMPKPDRPSDA